jgi:hypothetical protein
MQPLKQSGVRLITYRIAAREISKRGFEAKYRRDHRSALDRQVWRESAFDPPVLRSRDARSISDNELR